MHSLLCMTWQRREPWKERLPAVLGVSSAQLYVTSVSQTRGKFAGCRAGEAVLLCTVNSRKEEGVWFLVWELRHSTEGQKLGAASEINLGVGARCLLSTSARLGHVLVGEHPRRGGAQLPSSVLSAQTARLLYRNCIYILYRGLPNKKKRLLLCFKRVGLGSHESGFFLVHQMVMGLQLQSSVGGWKAASSQAEQSWEPKSLSKPRTQSFARDGTWSLERGRLTAWQEKPPPC